MKFRYLMIAAALACGTEEEPPLMEPELVPPPTREVLTGTVIAADSFVVLAMEQNFMVNPFASSGSLPGSIPSTQGALLVLSVFDQSRPGFECMGGVFDTNCASIIVFEDQVSPSLSVELASGRATWFLQNNFTLDPAPPPG